MSLLRGESLSLVLPPLSVAWKSLTIWKHILLCFILFALSRGVTPTSGRRSQTIRFSFFVTVVTDGYGSRYTHAVLNIRFLHSLQSWGKEMVDGGRQARKCKKYLCRMVICSKHCSSFTGRIDGLPSNLSASLFLASHQQDPGRRQALHLSCLTNS